MAGCAAPEPPAPKQEITTSYVAPDVVLNAMRDQPLSIFHPDAEPGARALAKELRHVVDLAIPLANTESEEALEKGRRVGTILGAFERAVRCAQDAKIARAQLNRTAVAIIEAGWAYGLAADAPKRPADALAWAERQDQPSKLTGPLADLAAQLPTAFHDAMKKAQGETRDTACP